MKLTLPRRSDGSEPQHLSIDAGNSFVIIGANGAGKTRFTSAVVESIGASAFRVSALDGLYGRHRVPDMAVSSLRSRCDDAVVAALERGGSVPTGLEMLLAQLMHEEMLNLIGYKLAVASNGGASLKRTRLDRVIDLWQGVFPDNKMLIDSGKILFSRGMAPDSYSEIKLSDGERAVLYYAGAVCYAPKGAVIFVDSPEIFLHPTLTNRCGTGSKLCGATACFVTPPMIPALPRRATVPRWYGCAIMSLKQWRGITPLCRRRTA